MIQTRKTRIYPISGGGEYMIAIQKSSILKERNWVRLGKQNGGDWILRGMK